MTPATLERKERASIDDRRRLFGSDELTADVGASGDVVVEVRMEPGPDDQALMEELLAQSGPPSARRAKRNSLATRAAVALAARAFADLLRVRFAHEIDGVVDAYRVILRESMIKGNDPALQTALNRARLQEKILAGTSMVDQGQACELLGLSASNPSATMKRKEERREVLRFTVDGRAEYPLFQFDVEGRRLFPAMARIIGMKPQDWSDFRLLHWLTRPHYDFETVPADALGLEEDAVIAAFEREIEPVVHG